jgi:uncharacterized protein YoxC
MTVASDGLSVTKRFEEDEFPVPAIAFEIRSERPETVTVRLVDDVPEGVAVDDLGFHPEYGSEYWTIEEDRITFEREIEAESEYTTVYGIRATGADDVDRFLDEPRIEAVDPPLEEGTEVVDEDSSDIVRDLVSGDSESVPGLDDEGDPGTPEGEGPDLGELGAAGEESLLGALAAEIRNGNVDDDDLALLREALAVDGASGSTEARVERLQRDVADLLAYTDALEEFLDENGAGAEVVEGLREDVENALGEVRDVRETIQTVQTEVRAVEDEVETEVESVDEELANVSHRIDALDEHVGDIDVSEVEAQLADVESEIEELKEWREQLSSVMGG